MTGSYRSRSYTNGKPHTSVDGDDDDDDDDDDEKFMTLSERTMAIHCNIKPPKGSF